MYQMKSEEASQNDDPVYHRLGNPVFDIQSNPPGANMAFDLGLLQDAADIRPKNPSPFEKGFSLDSARQIATVRGDSKPSLAVYPGTPRPRAAPPLANPSTRRPSLAVYPGTTRPCAAPRWLTPQHP
jgi:hypothetical protein